MGAPHWSPEDDERLRAIAARGSRRDAMAELGRTLPSIKRRALRLKLRFAVRELGGPHLGTRARNWTREEDATLAILIGEKSYGALARMFGRSKSAIASRVLQLGLDSAQGRLTIQEAAARLGVSWSTVAHYRDKLGKRWRRGNGAQPGMEIDDVADVARAILAEPTSQVRVSATHLRRIAEGDLTA